MINIKNEHAQILKRALINHLKPSSKVYAFGSRVKGSNRAYSDLDIVIKSEPEISQLELIALKEALAESNIPFRIDISLWSNLSERFKHCIENELVEIEWKLKN